MRVCVCVPMFVCVSVDTEELSAHGKHCMPETDNEVHAKTKQEQVYKYSNRNDIIRNNRHCHVYILGTWSSDSQGPTNYEQLVYHVPMLVLYTHQLAKPGRD